MFEGINKIHNEFMSRHYERTNELNVALEALKSCADSSESDLRMQKINKDLDDLLADL